MNNNNNEVTVTGNVTVTTGDRTVPVDVKLGPVPGVPDERVARAVAADIVIAAEEGASQLATTWVTCGTPTASGVLVPSSDPESTVVVVAGIVTVVSGEHVRHVDVGLTTTAALPHVASGASAQSFFSSVPRKMTESVRWPPTTPLRTRALASVVGK